MNIDDLLGIIGFAASLAALVISLLSLKKGKKFVAILTLSMVILGCIGISLYRSYKHELKIEKIKKEIIDSLSNDSLTFDELHVQLLFRTFPEVKEALFQLIEGGRVRHFLIRSNIEGKLVSYRVYYCQDKEINAQHQSSGESKRSRAR